MCYDAEWSFQVKQGKAAENPRKWGPLQPRCLWMEGCMITKILLKKFDPMCPAFQGHSRSSEPTRIDRLMTCNVL